MLDITYEEYRQSGGQLDEATFQRVLPDAQYTVSMFTLGRSEEPPENMQKRVKDCLCAMVDLRQGYRESEELLPRGIGSTNNAGLSVSRSVRNGSTAEADEQQDYDALCRKYLTRPVNLMYRGIG